MHVHVYKKYMHSYMHKLYTILRTFINKKNNEEITGKKYENTFIVSDASAWAAQQIQIQRQMNYWPPLTKFFDFFDKQDI